MDLSFILGHRLAVGGGIWTAEAMDQLARMGFTHLVNLQLEFDNRALAAGAGVVALWNPTEDDLAPKPPEFFERSVNFALDALAGEDTRLYVHCAAGIHRGPITAAAILCGLGYDLEDALGLIASRRAGADFPEIYVESLRRWAAARRSDSEEPGVRPEWNASRALK